MWLSVHRKLAPDPPRLAQMSSFMRQSQVEGESQTVPNPGNKRRLYPGPPNVQPTANGNPVCQLPMHGLKPGDRLFHRMAGRGHKRRRGLVFQPGRVLRVTQEQTLPPVVSKLAFARRPLFSSFSQGGIPFLEKGLTGKHKVFDTVAYGPSTVSRGRMKLIFRQRGCQLGQVGFDSRSCFQPSWYVKPIHRCHHPLVDAQNAGEKYHSRRANSTWGRSGRSKRRPRAFCRGRL